MSATKTHVPLYNTTHSAVASTPKSHVLAGVQDAYWSDDEAEDVDCPLCLEEMDLSDINFKPCPCGYQICRFCWHHIKENLNGRCPACRREYTEEAVEFKPISPEDQKRLNQQRRLRDRERKELENLKRSHLANVRVVQRNLVYVTGLGSRFAKEELIPSLRSTEYFGKYGKISKIVLVKRTASASRAPVVGLYITYHRREDAARAIAAVDGTASPGGDGDIVRASYGTTKYCMCFLRGVACTTQGCLDLHEWGDDKDCFTKEDLSTLKHAMKDTENRQRIILQNRKQEETDASALPATASWGQKGGTPVTAAASPTPLPAAAISNGRATKTNGRHRDPAPSVVANTTASRSTDGTTRPSATRSRPSERRSVTQNSGTTSNSRPSTPGFASLPPKPTIAAELAQANSQAKTSVQQDHPSLTSPKLASAKSTKSLGASSHSRKQKSVEKGPVLDDELYPAEPETSPAAAPRVQDIRSESVPPLSPSSTVADSISSNQTPPPPPPGLLPLGLGGQSTYQLSTQAKALMEDVLNRRGSANADAVESPFPDFDRTLSNLGDGSFSFNLSVDPKLAAAVQEAPVDIVPSSPMGSGVFDPFANSGVPQSPFSQPAYPPPGLVPRRTPSSTSFPHSPLSSVSEELKPSRGFSSNSAYSGSFNPFAESTLSTSSQSPVQRAQPSPLDDDPLRRGSKFGFARKESSNANSFNSGFSGSTNSSPLRYNDTLPLTPLYASSDVVSPKPQPQQPPAWAYQRQQEYSTPAPPGMQHTMNGYDKQSPRTQFQTYSAPQQSFAPFGTGMAPDGAINFKDILAHGNRHMDAPRPRDSPHHHQHEYPNQGFVDPAIMSVRMSYENSYTMNNARHMNTAQQSFSGPPGLTTSSINPIDNMQYNIRSQSNVNSSRQTSSPNPTHAPASSPSTVLSPILYTSDFPALPMPSAEPLSRREHTPLILPRLTMPKAEPIAQPKTTPVPPTRTVNQPPPRVPFPLPAKPLFDGTVFNKPILAKSRANSITESTFETAPAPTTAPPVPSPIVTPVSTTSSAPSRKASRKPSPTPASPLPVVEQEPLLSRKARKNKATGRPVKAPKEKGKSKEADEVQSITTNGPVLSTPGPSSPIAELLSNGPVEPQHSTGVEGKNGVEQLAHIVHDLHLDSLSFFDRTCINPKTQSPLRYGPLVYALSTLSIGGASAFSNSLPAGSIDSAVTSFQQLLETLTQTISDLLRLFPRATWNDTAPFDGVLWDMLHSDDFLDDVSITVDAPTADGREDGVAALPMALEKRARWMEVQLAKLEELHRDINLAAVRAVMSFNDRGWGHVDVLPRVGGSLTRFDALGTVTEADGSIRDMTIQELEEAHAKAVEMEITAEAELTKALETNQALLLLSA